MNEECRLITKEEYDKYLHIKNCCVDNARLCLENAELRELLKLISDELNYFSGLTFIIKPQETKNKVNRIQLLIFKQLNKSEEA